MSNIKKFSDAPPPIKPLGGGWSRRLSKGKSKPRYDYWLIKDLWTLDEAANLLCDQEPEYIKPSSKYFTDDSLYKRIKRTYSLLQSSYEAEKLKSAGRHYGIKFNPRDIVEWAISKELSVPVEFTRLIKS